MALEYRSVTFRCECGKCHSFYGKDAADIGEMAHVCCNQFFANRFEINVIKMVRPLFACCDNDNRTVHWDIESVYED